MGKDKSTASKEAKRAHSNAQAKAQLKRVEKRKRAVSRNRAESAGVYTGTPAVLFQTPHTSGPVLYNDDDDDDDDDDDATPRVHTQGEMSGREDTREDASKSPPVPSIAELDREFRSYRDDSHRGREVRHAARQDGELAFLIAGALCGHAACVQLLFEHSLLPSLPPHVQHTCQA
eukprot:300053-Pelagomonas_calceolata.AAC.1